MQRIELELPFNVSAFSVIQMIHADSTSLPEFYGTQV